MQDGYTGDIGDFSKLGLLRQLRCDELSIGVNWYRTPYHDLGKHTAYLKKEEFCCCDRELCRALKEIVDSGRRQVAALEGLLPDTAKFYSPPLVSDVPRDQRQIEREAWHTQALKHLGSCDIIFVDQDNGLMVPSAQGTPQSNKFVLASELADYYRGGASVIYYQHKARRPDDFYIQQHRQLLAPEAFSGVFPGAMGLGLKFTKTSQRYYFFFLQPRHRAAVCASVARMMETPWRAHFELLLPSQFEAASI